MADSSIAEPTTREPPLDDVMLAMDIVDTLRHRASLIENELNADERNQDLIARLREIYKAQGIEVSDRVLAEGVTALREDRFKHTPPRAGLSVALAKAYINRRRWGVPLLMMLALAAVAWVGYVLLVSAPRARALRELPKEVAAQQKAISDVSREPKANDDARKIASNAERALAEGKTSDAKRELEQLKDLRVRLEQQYELQIVVEGSTGVWRIPSVNEKARNYYIIVQPVALNGQILTLPMTSEEDGKTKRVSKWGLRVDEATFHQIAADKQDDGIIQKNKFGVKRAGYLEPEYLISTSGGAITSW